MNGSVEGQYSVMVSWLLENRLENLILPSFLLRTEKSLTSGQQVSGLLFYLVQRVEQANKAAMHL